MSRTPRHLISIDDLDRPGIERILELRLRELENVAGAYSGIEARIRGGDSSYEVTPELLRELNRQVLDGLEVEQHGVSGELRSEAVVASGEFLGAPAPDREHLLELLCAWLNGPDFEPGDNPSQNFLRGVVRAVLAHVYIEWIRPFGDGNGQTARLVEFGILASAGVPLAAAHLLADHYDQTRTAYRRQLAHATRSGGDVRVFLAYAIEGFVDGLQAQLRLVYEHVANVTWAAYVHEVFQGADTRARTRQREIVLALPTEAADPWMPRAGIPAISSKVAELYSGRGPKAVSRDINALFDLGLIERRRDAIRPKVEIMLGFLPPVASTAVF